MKTYIGIGGEDDFTDADLINRNVFGVYKNGIMQKIIPNGNPEEDEVYFDAYTGYMRFGTSFYAGEKALIQYA